jgi:Ca2+-binding EF-hand superfamily protein|uniref:EF-hand domain-containing protein n=1 Tax=Haptolina ericina TaxID=156174 RepID=A0A7S3ETB0_9EUKA|eukprot:CAMPEP_0181250058 /NCGR_PEP_ID=MMETSP1096-20121128/46109_1 /TAXON_ID=156174 ORGANISM="Chrysochromulina ericina, Strain CCMP281" /NCGR_SAMPLE_ID=MMETSP1096 /ASSEMBLY_ACC=CAM_ASM_000453 /LENGTH=158 /DNA_ID=CAMNT_0023347485 /DNA_START=36 /DNA_END=512 /DNA_ORIENTATION=+
MDKLDQKEQESLHAAFDAIDRNGGGTISSKELGRFFETTMKRELTEVQVVDMCEDIKDAADELGSIGFDFQALAVVMEPIIHGDPAKMHEIAWKAIDKTNAGFVSSDDLVPIFTQLNARSGVRLGEEAIRKIINSASKTQGKVTFEDYMRVMNDPDAA